MIQWWFSFSPGLTSETEPKWSSLDFWTSRFERWFQKGWCLWEMPWKCHANCLHFTTWSCCLLRKMMINIRNLACGKIPDEDCCFHSADQWIVSWGGSPVVWDSFGALGWNHQILPRSMFLLKGKHANLQVWQDISISICPYLSRSISIHIYPYLSICIHIYPYLSLSIHIYPYSLIFIDTLIYLYVCLSISLSYHLSHHPASGRRTTISCSPGMADWVTGSDRDCSSMLSPRH